MTAWDRASARDRDVRELRASYNATEANGSRHEINDGLRRLLSPEPTWWQRVITKLRRATEGITRTGRHASCEGAADGRPGTPPRVVPSFSPWGTW